MRDDSPAGRMNRFLGSAAGRVVLLVAILAALALAITVGVSLLDRRHPVQETRGDLTDRFQVEKTISYQGVDYSHRPKLTKILFMGIDQDSDVIPAGSRSGGQADFLMLLVLDAEAKTMARLEIDRDTMTPITVLGVLGNPAGTRVAQISLSHGFGDGRAQSGQFTADAVTRLLQGEPVDYYVALSLDGISSLNDWAGGVTVTLADDFSSLDPDMLPGVTLTLHGMQAEYFVRSRMNVGIGTNEARMARQRVYIQALGELLDAKIQENADCIGDLFDQLEPYLVTDMKRGRMINLAWATRAYTRLPMEDLPGEHRIGSDGFMEFYPDQDLLTMAIIHRFYDPVTTAGTDVAAPQR